VSRTRRREGRRRSILAILLLGVPVVAIIALIVALQVRDHVQAEKVAIAQATYTPPAITRPPDPDVIAFVGDSWTTGSDMNTGPAWPQQISEHLGAYPQVVAAGGTGYLTARTTGSPSTMVDQALTVPPGSKVIVFLGGRNDSRHTVDEIEPAVRQAFVNAKKTAPHAELVVVPPPFNGSHPYPWFLQMRDAIKKEAARAGAIFVDPIAQNWFPDGSDMIGSDGVHPTNDGEAVITKKLAPQIEKALKKATTVTTPAS
jgi:lysophospholipase L1-like esterase